MGTRYWREVVVLDGVDVSARLTDDGVTTSAEEGGQGIFNLTLKALPGSVNLDALRGKAVTVSYQTRTAGGTILSTELLMTGNVDLPRYDPGRKTISLRCTDRRDDRIALLSKAAIDALTPGAKWSSDVFESEADSFQYASDRLRTLPGALDCEPDGDIVYTAWAAASPHITFTASGIFDGEPPVQVEVAPASSIRNRTVLELTYRYEISYQREASSGWTYSQSTCQYLATPTTLPTRDMARRAAEGLSGWLLRSMSFTPLWPTGTYACSPDVNFINNQPQLIIGYSAVWVKRWTQTIDEIITVTLSSTQSISTYGERRADKTGSMSTDFDVEDYEGPSGNNQAAALSSVGGDGASGGSLGSGSEYPPLAGAVQNDWDDWRKEHTDRTAWAGWIETHIAIASVEHLASHRLNRAVFAVPLNPGIAVQKTLRVNSVGGVTCTGKVVAMTHVMDARTGEARTDVELALSRAGAAGVSDPLMAPTPPSYAPTPPPTVGSVHAGGNHYGQDGTSTTEDDAWTGYRGNYVPPLAVSPLVTFSDSLRVDADEIEAAVRDNTELPDTAAYEVAPPHDELSIAA
ncbi:MAG: hypothetical protein FLDDKLPJ_00943 [Phycisphaerae bacterium]|nr:hypothetical protein [Phycisphaerae bacterium]